MTPLDQLGRLATRIESNAAISARSGQMEDLENIAAELRSIAELLGSWPGILQLLGRRRRAEIQLQKDLMNARKIIDDRCYPEEFPEC